MSIQWSHELSYAVGLIATDGCLYNDGRHLELTSKDIEQLETFKRCLGLNSKIGWKGSSYSTRRYPRVQFGNVKLYRWLLGIGLMPCKSKRLGPLLIPENYFFDFLRGSLDGDGCICTFQDPVYPGSTRLYVSFHSASSPHLQWIHRMVTTQLPITGFIRYGTRLWQLTYAKKASQQLLKALYYRPNLPCLQRKYRIAKPFL